eukprot:SAG25_NODE_687_length_5922_cov_2.835995_3_plen_627_part_00
MVHKEEPCEELQDDASSSSGSDDEGFGARGGLRTFLSLPAVVVSMSGAVQHALVLQSAYKYENSGSYSIAGRNDVAVIGDRACAGLEKSIECLSLYQEGLRLPYEQPAAASLETAHVMALALSTVRAAAGKLALNAGAEIKAYHCMLDRQPPACKDYEGPSAVEILQCDGTQCDDGERAERAAVAIEQGMKGIDGLDARHGSSLRNKIDLALTRLGDLRLWFKEPSAASKAAVEQAMKAVSAAAPLMHAATTEVMVRAIAKTLVSTAATGRLGLRGVDVCTDAGPKRQKGLDYALLMAFDWRALVFVGPLHAGLRCIPSLTMNYPARVLEMVRSGAASVFWGMTGLISNIANSRKLGLTGVRAKFATASQVYGRKIWKFCFGYDIRDKDILISPCAAAALPSPMQGAQEARCTLSTFMWMLYDMPDAHELFGITHDQAAEWLLKAVDAWMELNNHMFPAEEKERKGADAGTFWFGWNKRSCVYYAVELPLRFLAGLVEPWEAPCEEAQGFGRQCMRVCLPQTAQSVPLHNVCALDCFMLTKSSALDTNEAMRADLEAHRKKIFAKYGDKYKAVLAKLPAALAFRLPDDWVSPWRTLDAEAAQELDMDSHPSPPPDTGSDEQDSVDV